MTWNNKGFTFVELCIVVAIIGILASIAIPQFKAYRVKAYKAYMTEHSVPFNEDDPDDDIVKASLNHKETYGREHSLTVCGGSGAKYTPPKRTGEAPVEKETNLLGKERAGKPVYREDLKEQLDRIEKKLDMLLKAKEREQYAQPEAPAPTLKKYSWQD